MAHRSLVTGAAGHDAGPARRRRVLERPRRPEPSRRHARGPRDRRAPNAVGRAAPREREGGHRAGRAQLDCRSLRRAAAGADPARTPRPDRAARLQLCARARRLLGHPRPLRGCLARAQPRGCRRLPGARCLSGGALGRRARRRRGICRSRGEAARVRRHRADDRAARHRSRPLAPVSRGKGRAGNRHRGRDGLGSGADEPAEPAPGRAARHPARRRPRRLGRAGWDPRRRAGSLGAPDPHRRLAAHRKRPERGLRDERPADRRPRPGGRSQRRRRHPRRRADRAARGGRAVRLVSRQSRVAGGRRGPRARHARCRTRRERRARRAALRLDRRPFRRKRRADRRSDRFTPGHGIGARRLPAGTGCPRRRLAAPPRHGLAGPRGRARSRPPRCSRRASGESRTRCRRREPVRDRQCRGRRRRSRSPRLRSAPPIRRPRRLAGARDRSSAELRAACACDPAQRVLRGRSDREHGRRREPGSGPGCAVLVARAHLRWTARPTARGTGCRRRDLRHGRRRRR